jgi:hypothetical protein
LGSAGQLSVDFASFDFASIDLANIEQRLPAASLKDVFETTSSVDHVL